MAFLQLPPNTNPPRFSPAALCLLVFFCLGLAILLNELKNIPPSPGFSPAYPAISENIVAKTAPSSLFEKAPSPFVCKIPDLKNALSVEYVSPRPDRTQGLFFLRSTKGFQQEVVMGQKIYFQLNSFSDDFERLSAGSCYLLPEKLGDVSMEFLLHIDTEKIGAYVKEGQASSSFYETKLVLPLFRDPPISSPNMPEHFAFFSKAKSAGKDLYLSSKPAAKNRDKRPYYWIVLPDQTRRKVQVNDLFIWSSTEWKKVGAVEKILDKPVLKVLKADTKGLFFQGWDACGSKTYPFFLASSPVGKEALPTPLIKHIQRKTPNKVKMEIDQIPLLLAVGSWAVKIDGVWKALPKRELESHIGKGPFFYLKQVKKKARKKWLSGKLYNAFRTEEMDVYIEIPNKQSPPSHMKRSYRESGRESGRVRGKAEKKSSRGSSFSKRRFQ